MNVMMFDSKFLKNGRTKVIDIVHKIDQTYTHSCKRFGRPSNAPFVRIVNRLLSKYL